MNSVQIEWTSNDNLMIPHCGMTFKGRMLSVPKEAADSFISRGMAKLSRKPSKKQENK